MRADKKRMYIIALLFPCAAALSLFALEDASKNAMLALICVLYAIMTASCIRKRDILQTERRAVLFAVTIASVFAVSVVCMAGIKFGFVRNPFAFVYLWKYILPFSVIVVFSEWIRRVILAQHDRAATVIVFIGMIVLDCLMQIKQGTFTRFETFVAFFGATVFPAVSIQLLCLYLSGRYGMAPAVVFRLTALLWRYALPVLPDLPDMLSALVKFAWPLVLLGILHALFAKRKITVSRTRRRISNVVFILLCGIALALSMLISCRFSYCLLIIGSPSMSGAIETGDGVIYRVYDGQTIEEGDVIVYRKGDIQIVHRVIDVQYINGSLRYYTRGDANEADDPWYVTESDIVGTVVLRIRYIGSATLALRSAFG